ncbi:MAG: HEPN domain-containing protein, partial [Thermodesulfobacteriota bacterium]|nr:HEPN domain-containing protein [Thermodesulfobacteriota bacterium]
FNELPMQVNYAFSGKSSFYFYAILHRKFKQFSIVVQTLSRSKLYDFGVFIAMSIRLATGVPIDIPYWFDVENDEIKGYGNTLINTYRVGKRYLYPLDDGIQHSGLIALQKGLSTIAQKHIKESSKNVLIRAIEFAAIGFQNRHIPSRLVNNTIFLESLFSLSNTEIGFQIAASVSWYLKSGRTPEERDELFKKVKELYGYRSKIVHGADISLKNRKLLENCLFSKEMNTDIFQNILVRNDVEAFSMPQKKRQEELRKLSLGAGSIFLD